MFLVHVFSTCFFLLCSSLDSVTIELDYDKNEKEEVDIQDISPEFLQSLFDLKITPGILKTADGKKIPIKKERLQPNGTYTLLTSKTEKKKKLSKNDICYFLGRFLICINAFFWSVRK